MSAAQSVSKNLFGNSWAIGQSLTINANIDVLVTGVYRDLPLNSKFTGLKFIAPFSLAEARFSWLREQDWKNHLSAV